MEIYHTDDSKDDKQSDISSFWHSNLAPITYNKEDNLDEIAEHHSAESNSVCSEDDEKIIGWRSNIQKSESLVVVKYINNLIQRGMMAL